MDAEWEIPLESGQGNAFPRSQGPPPGFASRAKPTTFAPGPNSTNESWFPGDDMHFTSGLEDADWPTSGGVAQAPSRGAKVRPTSGIQNACSTTQSEAGDPAVGEALVQYKKWRKSIDELHENVNDMRCTLTWDPTPPENERFTRIKARVEMFFNITKNIRDVMGLWCSTECNETVHDAMELAETAFQRFGEGRRLSDLDFVPTMKNVCSILFRFIIHCYDKHTKDLASANEASFQDIDEVFKLLYTFTKEFRLMDKYERSTLDYWLEYIQPQ